MPPTKDSVVRSMKRLHRSYVRDCKRRNVYWELSIEQFHTITSQDCVYCGRPPSQVSRSYVYSGIDRMNPKRGYELSNCVSACKECNWIKGDRLTFEEMKAVGEALRNFREKNASKSVGT